MDTIFAEATPPGRGGVSVVRLSGPEARPALERLAGPVAEARRAVLRMLQDGDDLIDQALVIRFDQGASFTGEETAEIHLHGAPVVVDRLAQALLGFGLRRAEAGEFSRRAFLNGQMDLAAAEGLADLLAAETEAQRQLAMRAVSGEVAEAADRLRNLLVRAGALVEASIDFADEDVPDQIPDEVFRIIADVRRDIFAMLDTYPATERLRQGYEVAIVGPPNAGKSTLLNRIAKREIALVSEIAGTTRDILELRTDLKGLPVTFLDTAGIRESTDRIEAMGVARAEERARAADMRIHLSEDGRAVMDIVQDDLVVQSKVDDSDSEKLSVSARTGRGITELLDLVHQRLRTRAANCGLITHRRQAEALHRTLQILQDPGREPEIVAESLRQASMNLLLMVGRIGAEDYLDEIFASFCIGK